MSPARLVVALLGAGIVVSCSVDDLDVTGKACPCPSGWVCDPGADVCVVSLAVGQGGVGGTGGSGGGAGSGGSVAGTGGGVSGSAGASPGVVLVSNLRVDWTTPNTIRWEWDAEGVPDDLQSYQLVVGTSESDVVSRSGSADVWDETRNPELARFLLPRTGGEDKLVATMTDGHQPATAYFGQLIATDTSGGIQASNVAGGRTTDEPINEIVIFHDAEPAGFSIPLDAFVRTDRAPYQGTHHFEYLSDCGGEAVCYEIPRRQELNTDLREISEGTFSTTAFVEFAVASDGAFHSYWSETRVMMGPQGDTNIYGVYGWTMRADGEYRLMQFPLRAFGMPYDELARGLFELGVGGIWEDGTTGRVDEIRIRW